MKNISTMAVIFRYTYKKKNICNNNNNKNKKKNKMKNEEKKYTNYI